VLHGYSPNGGEEKFCELRLYGVLGSWKRLRAIQYEGHPHVVAFMVAGAFALLAAPVVAFASTSDNPKRRGARVILF
jgi:hypothetical protein